MKKYSIAFVLGMSLVCLGSAGAGEFSRPCENEVATSPLSLSIRQRQWGTSANPGPLRRELLRNGFAPGSPVLFRILKEARHERRGVLEAWILRKKRGQKGEFELFKKYPIVAWSGSLGPKLKEGDGQTPEGFYFIRAGQMNPLSHYHLSMDVGYPNPMDRSLGRTGSQIMIHGKNESRGCFAMGDEPIEEIYLLAEEALMNCVPEIPIFSFPFEMTSRNLDSNRESTWYSFWENLAEGSHLFDEYHLPPRVSVSHGRYSFQLLSIIADY